MINKFINVFLGLSPEIIQPYLLRNLNSLSRENQYFQKMIISDWEKNGKPSPPPHIIKQLTIKDYQQKTSYKTFVETGTYLGDMIEAQKNNFSKLYSIELSEKLWEGAIQRFKSNPRIEILQGDSGHVLNALAAKLEESSIFWLDGHYSGGFTAKGDKDCPVYEELEAIFKTSKLRHVILIDDARLFVGADGYPTLDELSEYVKKKLPEYIFLVKDDIIRLSIS